MQCYRFQLNLIMKLFKNAFLGMTIKGGYFYETLSKS